MIYTFQVKHLDCANCANKIEVQLNKEAYIEEASLNFMLKKLTIVCKQEIKEEELREKIEKLADAIEKGVQIIGTKVSSPDNSGVDTSQLDHPNMNLLSKLKLNKDVILLGVSLILLVIGIIADLQVLLILAYICVGYDVVIEAAENLFKGSVLDENFLMTLATVAAFIIGEYPEAVAVMVFYKIGEHLEDRAVGYSRKEIAKAMDIRPSFARVLRENEEIVAPSEVRVGETIEVRPGEKMPLDGIVIEGTSTLDTSMLTGEALPVVVEKGTLVLSGSINKEGVIKVQVTEAFQDSTVSKILELIENASSKKSRSENFITKFARCYTPIVVGLAVFTAIVPSMITGDWSKWIYSSIIFLVISCPCALVVSVPLGFFAGIGAAAKEGVLVKGSNYLEALNTIDTVIFDKTGTITKGEFGVSQIIAENCEEEELLQIAAALESRSNHPIAKSIVRAHGKTKAIDLKGEYQEISGEGIVVSLEDEVWLAGNERLLERYQIPFKPVQQMGSHVYIARNGQYLGCIVVADQIKPDSKAAISQLKAKGIKNVIMLTGDKKEIAEEIASQVGIDQVYAELLPQDKVAKLEKALEKGKVAFVGDGINDAPVLARANVGVAMGGVGSDAAIEAADMILMTDELSSIGDVIDIAKRTRKIVTQNIVFALGVKAIVLILGILAITNIWLAIFADVGVSLLAVMNSIRVLGKNIGYMAKMIKG